MYTIKNFSTKKSTVDQLKSAGVKGIQLPFKATDILSVENNPVKGIDLLDYNGDKQKIVIK